jgi:2-polyprenyl-3-methyl-5-hydroxy-6-metoxy-1,4-benzoquinol methylase
MLTERSNVTVSDHAHDVAAGERFEFGRNWSRFLRTISESRIAAAEKSLADLFHTSTLEGRTFLDVGCGSGLSSLAARRMGARVHSFDYDPESVACTQALRARYCPGDPDWTIEAGSALDRKYLASLGMHDIVYSWGVLHHTGAMWQALENVIVPLKPGGQLCVAIYNDQGVMSVGWRQIKFLYNKLPAGPRLALILLIGIPLEVASLGRALVTLQLAKYVRARSGADAVRGMTRWHDLVDWIGGYPFEVARPAQLVSFYSRFGLVPVTLRTCGRRLGCNEFVFADPRGSGQQSAAR